MTNVLAIALGALGWTLAEYVLHRFDGHGMQGKTSFSSLHLAHHARPDTFAPARFKARAAGITTVPMATIGWFAAGAAGLWFTASFVATYLTYEWFHRRLHTHPPRTAWGMWARRHHFQHHFLRPSRNHGVTTPLWDWVFRTQLPASRVRVPRRHAPDWLLGPDGAVAPTYARWFEVSVR